MDPTLILAKHFVKTGYKDMPQDAVDGVKKEVLDSLGTALAGSSAQGIKELIEVLEDFGGKKQCTVIAKNTRLPILYAAQVNAAMTHALDLDDSVFGSQTHTGSIVVPVVFALSEFRGKVSGKDCITAIALGTDFMARLGLATKYKVSKVKAGWFYTPLYGYMTAAAVTGKILGFSEDQIVNAIGLGYQQSAGNQQAVVDGVLAKRMGPGFAVSGGILAALMAEKGITGAKQCIEGEYGLYNIYHRGGYDREALLKDLGTDFKVTDLIIKIYPSCRITHPFIDATLALITEHRIKPEQVKEITVYGGEAGFYLISPLEVKCRPRNPVDCQFSVPWLVATAIVKGKVSLEDITEEATRNADVLKMAEKIKAQKDPELVRHGLEPGKVSIITRDGVYTKQVEYLTNTPVSFDVCARKFRDCASHSVKPLSDRIIENTINSIANLEKLDDISEIIRALG